MKGIELTGEKDQLDDADVTAKKRTGTSNASVVTVDGKSSVYLHGDSSVNGYFPVGLNDVVSVTNGGYLELAQGATFNTSGVEEIDDYVYQMSVSNVFSAKSGSTIVNNGDMAVSDFTAIEARGQGSTAINNGHMDIVRSELSTGRSDLKGIIARDGASAVNQGTMTAKTVSQASITNIRNNEGMNIDASLNSYVAANEIMTAYKGSSVTNKGQIELYGRGVGMSAISNATADNFGKITTDAMWKDANDTSELQSNIPSGNDPKNYAVGMAATNQPAVDPANAVATNHEGATITVYNAGAGMVATAGNKAINQGTINLEKNENYDASKPLVGMAVYGGGIVINDTTGVININAENGKAFYSDGNKNNRIINYGQIAVGAGVPTDADNSGTITTPEFVDGTILSGTTTLDKSASIFAKSTVSNTGTIEGTATLVVEGTLGNQSTGVINAPVTVMGTLNNSGTVSSNMVVDDSGKVVNDGNMKGGAVMWDTARLTNNGEITLGTSAGAKDAGRLDLKNSSVFENAAGGVVTGDNNKNAVHLNHNSTLKNDKGATMNFTASSTAAAVNIWGGTADFINDGTVNATGVSVVGSSSNAGADKATFWNQDDGVLNFTATTSGKSAVSLTHNNYVGVNDGTMNISGNGAIGMKGSQNAQLVNNGTINLGTAGTTESGMVAMQLDAKATADAVIENNGAINIYAKDSYAFSKLGENGRIVNNGTVTLAGEGSGLIQQSAVPMEGKGTGGNGTETHAATYTLPTDPTAATQSTGLRSSINQYTVGTSANGSAGTLTASHVDIQDVNVDTGFTAGTAATTQTFNDVFVGEDIQGEQNITSTSVVWTAEGQKDANGNVDVTMTKNAYADVAGDASVNSVANALDAAYTNNELYTSLNLKTSAELDSALKQISGSKATGVSRDARILSNRFDMLADTAPVMNNGLAFNVVAKGDQRAELSNDTTYDMLALRQSLAFGGNQTLSMEYGIARLDGNGNAMSAGDNGVTGGYSQFFGLKHSLPLSEDGLSWDNALRYDVHNFDSNRAVRYGDVNKTANADTRQQYMEFRTEGSKAFKVQEGLTVAPFAGLKMRHTMEDGYSEKGAGDFNLNMSSSSETAVDAVVGLKLNYAGEDGWAATASLEGGPNLSYAKSNRTASLAGAKGQTFSVEDDQQGGGVNGQAMAGVKYSAGDAQFTADAYQWQEDGVKDKGFMVNYKYKF
ncbi:autotransporter domain-containing protein [Enterobacter kobei]|uniref:autotransporter domain-containing protein n=1 Tax=Enterobacter kobei TaxID=208224 RepID=UPI003A977BA1